MASSFARYIHTQEQAQAELERQRLQRKARRYRQKQYDLTMDQDASPRRKQNHTDVESSAEERAELFNQIQQRYALVICHNII